MTNVVTNLLTATWRIYWQWTGQTIRRSDDQKMGMPLTPALVLGFARTAPMEREKYHPWPV